MKQYKIILIVLLSCIGIFTPVHAQDASVVQVLHTNIIEEGDTASLEVYFVVKDATGRPLPDANPSSATIELLNSTSAPTPASIQDVNSRFYITLLIDGSGSMMSNMDAVRDAAKAMIDNAPNNAYFSVVLFNSNPRILLTDFTNNRTTIKNGLDSANATVNAGTCLYDALYDAVQTLDNQVQSPQEQRAIILFTDGKDQLVGTQPCSVHTYSDVMNIARPTNVLLPTTPIHTIGLKVGNSDINETELRRMATDTYGFSAVGDTSQLNQMFQQISNGLDSQFMAQTNICPPAGENSAVLLLNVRNRQVTSNSFTFFATQTCTPPPQTPTIIINELSPYDAIQDEYRLAISVNNTESVALLRLTIQDSRAGTQVYGQEISPFAISSPISFPGNMLQADREYIIRIQAVDMNQNFITDDDGEIVYAERAFVHQPPLPPAPPVVRVQSVSPDYTTNELVIKLEYPENPIDAERIEKYSGIILDKETSGLVEEFPDTSLSSSFEIRRPLSSQLASLKSYELTLYLTYPDSIQPNGQGRVTAETKEFKLPERPKVSLWQRITTALSAQPWITFGVLLILFALASYFAYRYEQNKKQKQPLSRPPIDKTIVQAYPPPSVPSPPSSPRPYERTKVTPPSHRPAPPPSDATIIDDDLDDGFRPSASVTQQLSPLLRVKVIKTPQMPAKTDYTIRDYPFVMGREGSTLNILGDQRISRRHAQITFDGRMLLTDLQSRNGTFLNGERLRAGDTVPITGTVKIGLGSQTVIEIDVLA